MRIRDKLRELIPWRRSGTPVEVRALARFRDEVDRLFDRFFDEALAEFDILPASRWFPSVDVSEDGNEVVVRAEVPGLGPEDLDVSVSDHTLVIRGEKRSEEEDRGRDYYRVERRYGSFHRAVPLPADVDPSRATATCKRGVLTVRLPRSGAAAAKRIPIAR